MRMQVSSSAPSIPSNSKRFFPQFAPAGARARVQVSVRERERCLPGPLVMCKFTSSISSRAFILSPGRIFEASPSTSSPPDSTRAEAACALRRHSQKKASPADVSVAGRWPILTQIMKMHLHSPSASGLRGEKHPYSDACAWPAGGGQGAAGGHDDTSNLYLVTVIVPANWPRVCVPLCNASPGGLEE